MNLSLRALSLASCAAALLAVAPVAHAQIFPIGGTTPTGLTLLDSVTGSSTSVLNTYTVNYTSSVFETSAGTLDFFYHINSMTDIGANTDALSLLSMSSFSSTGPMQLTSIDATGSGQAPNPNAALFSTGTLNILFQTNLIMSGQTSQSLWLITDATNFTTGTFSVSDASVAQLAGFQPAAATPEPGTFALMGTGFLTAAGFIRRRLKA